MSKSGNGGSDLVQKSLIPGAITMEQAQHFFLKEQAFTQSQRYIFGSLQTMWFLVDPTNYVPGQTQEYGRIIGEVPSFFAEAGPINVDFYNDFDLGTAVATALRMPVFNRIATSAITAQTVLSQLDKAPDTLGTAYSEILIPASATGGGQQVGFSVSDVLPFGLDLESMILMSVHNKDGADTDVGIRWNLFEI